MSDKSTKTNFAKTKISSLPLNEKIILWLPNSNKYILVNSPTDKIIEQIYNGTNNLSILRFCTEEIGFSSDEASQTIDLIKN